MTTFTTAMPPAMAMSPVKEQRFMARMAEQAGRFTDMVDVVRDIVLATEGEISSTDRHLFAAAYRHLVVPRRASWRILASSQPAKQLQSKQEEYLRSVEKELVDLCWDVVDVINKIMPRLHTKEAKLFFYKMKGDYFRYLAEIDAFWGHTGTVMPDTVKAAKSAYENAYTLAHECWGPADPNYLGLVLNYAVFEKEILGNTGLACRMTEEAFESALEALDGLRNADHRDVSAIMQLLRDNLIMWRKARFDGL
ncbi:14-3-3 family protein [Salpingoeca rosetta]|uniref:14-3-3 family protein n=1 Tax=Salpingoeca rosetta (strain ATCC 50818 / BSB-021) TaxID=946362 RepID=F2UFG7_SALR5|nr:14-3-3 family protein [Salpingoeca rosetta]EGD75535.1 14-3-3 family protein [Salpingoeca rosetta]|eukprot:XP_004991992.1 14-3-3 family protein [Salpingoeca rosetta]